MKSRFMSTRAFASRAGLVAGVVSILVVGGGVAAASSASADDLPFAITSPTASQAVNAGDIDVSGTSQAFADVSLSTAGGASAEVFADGDGQWDATLTVPTTTSGPLEIDAVDNNSPDFPTPQASVTVDVTPFSTALRVTSPQSFSTSASRIITFSGTAPVGSTVALTQADNGDFEPPVTVGSSGSWSITTRFSVGDPENHEVTSASATFGGTDVDGAPFQPVAVSAIALPPIAPTPVILTATGSGSRVTVTGTASGGPAVAVFFTPVDATALANANTLPDGSNEATGLVDSSGHFSAAATLAPGQWKASAGLLETDDVHTSNYLSLQSIGTPFTLTAAPAGGSGDATGSGAPAGGSVVAAAGAGDPASSGQLAFTGSSPLPGLLAAAVLLAAGLTLVVLRRRLAPRH